MAWNSETENDLLTRLMNGDSKAFEKLYETYSTLIFRNVFFMVKDKEIAGELLQDIFVKVWEKRGLVDPAGSFRAYLVTVARNRVYNYFREVSVETQFAIYQRATRSEYYSHIEEDIMYSEAHERLQAAIERLPPQRQKVFTLCKIEGKSYEEASVLLGISKSTINDHIVKALGFLKMELGNVNSLITLSILFSQGEIH